MLDVFIPIIASYCACVPRSGAAVKGTVLAQGDVSTVAGFGLANTHIATFVLFVRVTLLAAGVPLVFACVPTFPPTILIRAVTDDLTLCTGRVGGTVFGTRPVTRLCSLNWLSPGAGDVTTPTFFSSTGVPWSCAAV